MGAGSQDRRAAGPGVESTGLSDLAQAAPAFVPESLLETTLDGRYELTAHLASGGMGAVFRARHVHLRKDVAVKVLRPELSSAPEIVERFRREAEIASALEHENIVRVTDFGRSEQGLLFLVMELLTGESLFDRLRREGFLPPEQAVPILWQVCAGLDAAHAMGVVHRDLKPENVFLARSASGREVTKLLDFGIAKLATPAAGGGTQAGIVVGTPEYLAPEQATGGPVDARADLYAVGLIAWKTLAGRHPFRAEDQRALLMMQATQPVPLLTEARPDLAALPALVSVVARACAKDPAGRPPSAAALRAQLAAALGPAFLVPPGATPAPPPHLSPRRLTPVIGHASDPTISLPSQPTPPRPPALRRAAATVSGAARGVWTGGWTTIAWARSHPLVTAALAAALLAAAGGVWLAAWHRARPAAEARARLAAGDPKAARTVVDDALASRPGDPELLRLRGQALHRSGQVDQGIEAYRAARASGPLDAPALQDLAQDLGRERSLADHAARVLRETGAPAVPALRGAALEGPGVQRARALALLRDLGAEDQVDRVQAYGALLADPDCELRRAAAVRLGELGSRLALPRLREAAGAKAEKRWLLGYVTRTPACGAAEAAEAVKRIEAVR